MFPDDRYPLDERTMRHQLGPRDQAAYRAMHKARQDTTRAATVEKAANRRPVWPYLALVAAMALGAGAVTFFAVGMQPAAHISGEMK